MTTKKADKSPEETKEDITKAFASQTMAIISKVTPSISDPEFAGIANALLFIKDICEDMLQGKRKIE